MRLFGLIGYPLSHSFSKKYFSEKFEREGIPDVRYDLYEIPDIREFPKLLTQHPDLVGLNVTIPHKQAIMPYLDALDASAEKVGAVNVIRIQEGRLIGYNSDYYGFYLSLKNWLPENESFKALVLGSGGASKAVMAALQELNIPYTLVSRSEAADRLSYDQLRAKPKLLDEHRLVINTSPLGMSPHITSSPDIDYSRMGDGHYLYDLVYNPADTLFMQLGRAQGAKAKNGLEMLQLQAEKAWEIWNS